VLVTAAAVGLTVWKQAPSIPGFAEFDRTVFGFAVRAFSNPPFFVSGDGSHEQPWSLRTLTSEGSSSVKETLPVISIGDDPDGNFESSPPQAGDYAVILRNLKRLGVSRVALADQMVWSDADPYWLTALDLRLADFDSAVTTAALTRGSQPEPLPLPFYLASIPATQVKGDVAQLPQVNRVSLPGTFLGSGKTLAGFSILESEGGAPVLMARWKDRIVFSFPVIAALAEAGQKPADIEVRLGSYIKLGPGGPVVPIDANGHLASAKVKFDTKVTRMQDIIVATELESRGSVIARNDRSTADPETKLFSEGVANVTTAIIHETGLSPAKVFPRLSDPAESALLLVLSCMLFLFTTESLFRLRLAFSLVAAAILIAQIVGLGLLSVWLPLFPALSAVAAGYLVAWPAGKADKSVPNPFINDREIPEPEPETVPASPVMEASATAEEVPTGPAGKPAKKAARKTAKTSTPPDSGAETPKPSRKVAKKAAPAKKAAKKTATTAETPAKKAAKKAAKKSPKLPEPD